MLKLTCSTEGLLGLEAAAPERLPLETLDLSGSAFVLRLRDMPGAIRTILPSGEHSADLGSKEFLSVPASLVFVRRFGVDVSGGLGVFVPSQDRSDLGDTLRVEDVPFGGQVGG